jgi:Ca2+-binding RTX toxin-like protein
MVSCRGTPSGALAPATPARVEGLESRALMSVSLEQGVLTIIGTDGNDRITVGIARRAPAEFEQAAWRGRWRVERASTRYVEVMFNGKVRRFPPGSVRNIVIDAGAGDDVVSLAGDTEFRRFVHLHMLTYSGRVAPVNVDAAVHGGDGADFVIGGKRFDRLYGEGGDDRIIGLGGFDMLDGGEGNDHLGDACWDHGSSTLLGGPGDDVLVGHHDAFVAHDPPFSRRAQFVLHSLFGGPGNDQFQAVASEVRDLEPGESVTPAQCVILRTR